MHTKLEQFRICHCYLNYGRHPRVPSDLTLSSERKKAVKNAQAVDYIGNIEKAIAKGQSLPASRTTASKEIC